MKEVKITAWGMRYAQMPDADFHFDLRFLRNPHRDRTLRYLNGLDTRVQEDVFGPGLSKRAFRDALEMIHLKLKKVDKLHVVFVCTGGRHRSVSFAERAKLALASEEVTVTTDYPYLEEKRNGV